MIILSTTNIFQEAADVLEYTVSEYKLNCPIGEIKSKCDVAWWKDKIETLKSEANIHFNRVMKTG